MASVEAGTGTQVAVPQQVPPPAAWLPPLTLAGLLAVVAIAVGVPLAAAFATGAIDIPSNDSWAFARVAVGYAETGDLRLVGWGVMALVGHVLYVQPVLEVFGAELRVLHLTQAVTAVGALGVTYAVARAYLPPARALLATAVLAVAPGFATLSVTFMTDITAYFAQFTCLLLGVLALRTPRWRRPALAAALAFGLFALTVRETAVVAPAAVLAATLLDARARGRRAVLAVLTAAAATGALALAFLLLRARLPGDQVLPATFTPASASRHAAHAYLTAALVLGPVLVLASVPSTRRLRGAVLLVLGAVMSAAVARWAAPWSLVLGQDHTLFTGGYLDQRGSMASTALLGERPILIPGPVWALMGGLALAAGAALAAVLVPRRWRLELDPDRVLLALFTLGAAASALAFGFTGGVVFDRYLWTTIVAGSVLVLAGLPAAAPAPWWRRGLAGAWLALLAGTSLLVTVEEFTYDAARWRAGEAAVAAGARPEDVDAGFEWVGWHHDGVAFAPGPHPLAPPHPHYLPVFAGMGNCITVAASPVDDPALTLLDVQAYRPAGPLLAERRLYTYRNAAACALTAELSAAGGGSSPSAGA